MSRVITRSQKRKVSGEDDSSSSVATPRRSSSSKSVATPSTSSKQSSNNVVDDDEDNEQHDSKLSQRSTVKADVATPATTAAAGKKAEINSIDKKVDQEIVYEFGGPFGVTMMMIIFPLLMYYLWACAYFNHGKLLLPKFVLTSLSSFTNQDLLLQQVDIIYQFILSTSQQIWAVAAPTTYAAKIYLGYCAFSAFLSITMPGVEMKGMALPSEGGKKLTYLCNGVWSFYVTVITSAILHYYNIFRLSDIVDNFGPIMTVAIMTGFAITIITYFHTIWFGKPHRMSNSFMYDMFMGAVLNPRLFNDRLDLKMWSEIRVPWIVLFYVSVSAACKQYDQYGYVSIPLLFMCLAHFLYVNACMKGEECIPTTWDIFYEKWGFMLIFWNMAGVPFTYCLSTLYILYEGPEKFSNQPFYCQVAMFVILLAAYYVWDTANSQKNRFRMMRNGTYVKRYTFPQLPWGTLHNPRYLTTKHGNELLVDGWYRYARKIHYTADLVMALLWGLITGFDSLLPYFYVSFFIFVLTHRVSRDMERCGKKYGADWDKYCETVPYIFIPGIF